MAKLLEITGKAISGEWGQDDDTGTGIPVLRTTNFTNEGFVNYKNVVTRSISKKNIEKSGGSDKQPVGRVIFFEGEENKYLFNNFTGLLRVQNPEEWLPKYVFYALYAYYRNGGTRAFENRTTGLHNLQVDNYVKSVDIPKLSYRKQQHICETLDHVRDAVAYRERQLTKLDELVKARFVEMFGDMLLNSLEWPEKPLEGLADIVSGITKGRKTTETGLIEVPYMAVSNVKSGYIDWTTIKTILATKQEIEQYRLMPDDILMTEGGDPDKVGRGAIIKNPLKDSIHQNHIFRVRLDKSELLPAYFAEYLQHQKAKRYFLGCAKQTTGIASINMRQLRALPVLIPPLPLQNQFAAFVAEVDKSKLFAELFAQSTCILAENRSK